MTSNLGLVNKRESPAKMCEIIKNNEVILSTRNTRYRRGPDITVN